MTDHKRPLNEGYVPQREQRGYQPTPQPDPNPSYGYSPTESSGDHPTSTTEPSPPDEE